MAKRKARRLSVGSRKDPTSQQPAMLKSDIRIKVIVLPPVRGLHHLNVNTRHTFGLTDMTCSDESDSTNQT